MQSSEREGQKRATENPLDISSYKTIALWRQIIIIGRMLLSSWINRRPGLR